LFENLEIARLKYIMTMNCNFRCDYCFEGGKSDNNLDIDYAVKIGKQVLDEMKQDELTVLYFGGEPLLKFREMQLITQSLNLHAKKVNKRINFTTITNGTILTDEFVKHFKTYRYYISVSCDGIEPAQNAHRKFLNGQKTSFPMVERSIKILNEATKDFCVSMVVTDQNVKYLAESFEWLLGLGVRNFAISPVFDKAQYAPNPEIYGPQLMKIADLGAKIKEKLVINPPLDKTWDTNNATRRMFRTEDSVNVEVSPLGLNIVSERSMGTQIDFSMNEEQAIKKNPVSPELREAIIEVERLASKYYQQIKEEKGNC
jgi:sulfatase maturation enzyme AslB (radical SAM superfamily)